MDGTGKTDLPKGVEEETSSADRPKGDGVNVAANSDRAATERAAAPPESGAPEQPPIERPEGGKSSGTGESVPSGGKEPKDRPGRFQLIPAFLTSLNLVLLATAMLIATFATSEVGARLQAVAQINRIEADAIRSAAERHSGPAAFAPIALSAPINGTAEQGDPNVLPVSRSAYAIGEGLADTIAYVHDRAQEARSLLEVLSMHGSNVTTSGVLSAFEASVRDRRGLLAGKALDAFGPLNDNEEDSFIGWRRLSTALDHTRTDFLLSITVIMCALVGSIVAGLRRVEKGDSATKNLNGTSGHNGPQDAHGTTEFRPTVAALGLASGFIAFISLRGGRSVFMMELAGESPTFNPYSMAFIGLLVGLFSHKAWGLLSSLVDDLHGRIEGALRAPANGHPTGPPKTGDSGAAGAEQSQPAGTAGKIRTDVGGQ